MAKRKGKFRRKSRSKLKKNIRKKGKISIKKYFQKFKDGEKVYLKAEPAIQKGMFYPKYIGKSGIIKGKKGNCYQVLVKDKNKQKILIVHPIHLKKV